jgi:hypothetical protein
MLWTNRPVSACPCWHLSAVHHHVPVPLQLCSEQARARSSVRVCAFAMCSKQHSNICVCSSTLPAASVSCCSDQRLEWTIYTGSNVVNKPARAPTTLLHTTCGMLLLAGAQRSSKRQKRAARHGKHTQGTGGNRHAQLAFCCQQSVCHVAITGTR